ncbi:hypothetical protein CJ030_MR3G001207 [Morella rubra]|uniref:Uncharacterized protein n=1 Tax=Morella rubra TaxID=262757 RepID=A0A6A1W944_9ROSI|nr:hypothetical protein CJ030_MR3G001207 [Morella rubra]
MSPHHFARGSCRMASPGLGTAGAEGYPSSKGSVPVTQWVSDRTLTHLGELRLKYCIPPTIVLRVPEYKERVVCIEGDEIAFFEEALQAGARFPLSQEMRQLLQWFSLCPALLALNNWRLALGFFGLWEKLFLEERPSTWRNFAWCYKLQMSENCVPYFQA